MTSSLPSEAPRAVTVLGTGLIGTSVALAASRAGMQVRGWDRDPETAARAAATGALEAMPTLALACAGAELVVVATPIAAVAATVVEALRAAPQAVVTDAASIKASIVRDVAGAANPDEESRFVPGHPMGGSERSGPEHASASVVDAIVWVVAPTERTAVEACAAVEAFVAAIGARAVRLTPERHDRLVAFVSHLPQVASTTLMGLAATEEAGEPELLLLAAGGFRDLTRLASSNPTLWSEILLANDLRVAEAIDLFVGRLTALRDAIVERQGEEVERTFADAKLARLRLATKPTVRSGVAVLQTLIPDEPGALAQITALLGEAGVNIEDLQIVHSPEGGRGTLHLTVAAASVEDAWRALADHGYDPLRLA
ncbi:MAG: prephenate dehydrogenase/arogenate dehydrogenase family protein [Actinomycetota bacterium]